MEQKMSFIDANVSRNAPGPLRHGVPRVSISVWRAIPASAVLDFTIVYLVFFGVGHSLGGHFGAARLAFTALAAGAVICALGISSGYRIEVIQNPRLAARRILGGWGLVYALASLAATALYGARIWPDLAIGLLSGGVMLLAGRVLASAAFKAAVKRGLLSCNIVIFGSSRLADQIVAHCDQSPFGIRVCGMFGDIGTDDTSAAPWHLCPQTFERLVAFRSTHPVDTIVVAAPARDPGMLAEITGQLSAYFLNVLWLPEPAVLAIQPGASRLMGGVPGLRLVTLAEPPFRGWRAACKRCIDWVLALAAIIFLSPLLLLCVIGVKLSDPGPVLFRQPRIGHRNQAFEVYKFRSMFLNKCGHDTLTTRNDPRVFAFGGIMRKLSFDELPQLFNVLRGDMSLVGPRPHMPEARAGGILYTQAVPGYASRHRVKPGITGWAQVNGWRGPTDTVMQLQRRVDHDLDYIENWSLLLDFKILVKTALLGFFGKNAF